MDDMNETGTGAEDRAGRYGIWGRYALITLALITAIVLLSSARREERDKTGPALSRVMFGDFFLKSSFVIDRMSSSDASKYRERALVEYTAGAKYPVPSAIRRYALLRSYLGRGDALSVLERLSSKRVLDSVPESRSDDLRAEVRMWQDIFGGEVGRQLPSYRTRLERLHLGPAEPIALRQLYIAAGSKSMAEGAVDHARERYTLMIGAFAGLLIVIMGMGLAGLIFLTLFLLYKDRLITEAHRLAGNCNKIQHPVLWISFLIYMVAFLTMSVGIALVIGPLAKSAPADQQVLYLLAAQLVASVMSGATGLATLVYLARITGGDLCAVGLTLRDFWKNVMWGIIGYCSWLPVALFAVVISNVLFKGEGGEGHPIVPMLLAGGTWAKLGIFVLASVLAPFFEEIFFRGILYNALRARLTVPGAVVISAAAFAIVHPQLPAGFLPIFGIGAVFAVLFELRKSLVPSMVAHAINNTVVLLVTILAFTN